MRLRLAGGAARRVLFCLLRVIFLKGVDLGSGGLMHPPCHLNLTRMNCEAIQLERPRREEFLKTFLLVDGHPKGLGKRRPSTQKDGLRFKLLKGDAKGPKVPFRAHPHSLGRKIKVRPRHFPRISQQAFSERLENGDGETED